MPRGSATTRTVARYLIVGVLNTGVGLGTIYLCIYLFGMADAAANAVGYAIGIAFSFSLNKRWTFASKGKAMPQLVRFVAVTGVAYVANLVTVMMLAGHLGINSYVAQTAGIAPYTVIGYFGSRLFVFRREVG